MWNYILAFGSLLVALTALFLAGNKKYYGSVEKKYGEAAAQKMTRSLKIWGYFFLLTSGLLILALIFEGAR
jgi:hypothetical protein